MYKPVLEFTFETPDKFIVNTSSILKHRNTAYFMLEHYKRDNKSKENLTNRKLLSTIIVCLMYAVYAGLLVVSFIVPQYKWKFIFESPLSIMVYLLILYTIFIFGPIIIIFRIDLRPGVSLRKAIIKEVSKFLDKLYSYCSSSRTKPIILNIFEMGDKPGFLYQNKIERSS